MRSPLCALFGLFLLFLYGFFRCSSIRPIRNVNTGRDSYVSGLALLLCRFPIRFRSDCDDDDGLPTRSATTNWFLRR